MDYYNNIIYLYYIYLYLGTAGTRGTPVFYTIELRNMIFLFLLYKSVFLPSLPSLPSLAFNFNTLRLFSAVPLPSLPSLNCHELL